MAGYQSAIQNADASSGCGLPAAPSARLLAEVALNLATQSPLVLVVSWLLAAPRPIGGSPYGMRRVSKLSLV